MTTSLKRWMLPICAIFIFSVSSIAQKIPPEILKQMRSLAEEKATRTPAQKKVNSRLLYGAKMRKGQPITREVKTLEVDLKFQKGDMVKVDIKGKVNDKLVARMRELGADIIFSSAKYGSVVALVPIIKVEKIAELNDVLSIGVWEEPILNNNVPGSRSDSAYNDATGPVAIDYSSFFTSRLSNNGLVGQGSVFTGAVVSEADVTHKVALARAQFGTTGKGVKIGVLSDGITGIATSQANGELPVVTVLPGQAGNAGSEGRAMLELIHDLAPEAELYFATAFTSVASFAQNIIDLRAAGCDIIVDDVTYFSEGVFQDDIIARAVNTVTASGALYFTSAGNSGNKNDGTSGVWEGDFVNGGASPLFPGSTVHNFGGQIFNVVTANTGTVTLKWSDPLGGSANDYDLYATNSTGTTITRASTATQNGTQNPYEAISSVTTGVRIYIANFGGAAPRALHLNTNRGRLSINTPGVVYGHNAAANAISVAATPASRSNGAAPAPVGPFPGFFSASNTVELFSSDGPRRIFYNPDGTAITPGNILFGTSGGTVLQKPDLTAADGTLTATPGFIPFFGTSAAAPHAAAIAALVKSKLPGLSAAQIKTALIASAIDIEAPGVDRDAGAGIIMAFEALAAAGATPVSNVGLGIVSASEGSYGNGNGFVEAGELGKLTIQLINGSTVTSTNVQAVLSSSTPGVTITKGTFNYGNIGGENSANNSANPFTFAVNKSLSCGSVLNFTLTVSYGGGGQTPQAFNFSITLGGIPTISATLGSTPPTGFGFTSISGQQTGRLNRFAPPSTCAAPKAAPGLLAPGTGARQFDAYTFTNSTSSDQCVTITLNSFNGGVIYSAVFNNNGFVPANPNANFLADAGSSSITQQFSFVAPAGQQFTAVINDVNLTPASNSPYTLDVSLLTCNPLPACTAIIPGAIPAAVINTPYTHTLTATGGSGAYAFSIDGALPPGLSFDGKTISGTVTSVGSYPLKITATDLTGCPAGELNTTLEITCPVVIVNAPTVTQPTCAVLTGTIKVNASMANTYNTLEYSIDGGTTYYSSPTFSLLPAPGTYNLVVRVVGYTCTTTYAANPVVLIGDTEAPVIHTFANPVVTFYPPNHMMENIPLSKCIASVTDNCGNIPVSNVVITHVTSDEYDNSNGDGNTNNDIVISADCKSVDLRQERLAGSNGRVYTIYFKVKDASGNVGTASCKVVVPPNKSGLAAIDDGAAFTKYSNCSEKTMITAQKNALTTPTTEEDSKLQNFPNPFKTSTTIRFMLPTASKTSLDVYNDKGQKVSSLVNGKLGAGWHNVQFNTSKLAPGVYIYKLQTIDANGNPVISNGKMIKGN